MQAVTVDRDKYIGGSDIPIIMGISPFKTRWNLLQEKAGLLENIFDGNQYTEYGNVLEPKIRDYINKNQKDIFVEGKEIVDDIRCHTDGINKTTVLEIKTTSQIHDKLDEYKVYLVQLLFYMQYTKRKKGILAVYHRPDDFNEEFDETNLTLYDVDIKNYKTLLEEINLAVDDFRNDLRRIKENPFLTEKDLEPEELIELANQLEEVENDLLKYDEKIKLRDNLKLQIKTKLDEIGKKRFSTDRLKFTRVADGKDTTIETFDEERFKLEKEELYKKYSHEEINIVFDLDKLKEEEKDVSDEYITSSVKKGKAGYLLVAAITESNE